MEIKKIPWSSPDWGQEEIKAINRVTESGWVTMGKETQEFEKELASVTKYRYNIVFNSGTSAILASLLALGSHYDGYTVRIPSYTFKATENACYAAGLRDISYGDVDKSTGLMTPKEKERKRYEIQVPVHFAGLPIDQQVWGEVPSVVEDAAESFGSTTRHTGDVCGDRVVCYSFHAAKLITMIEGGCASTNDADYAYRLRAIRVHGEDPERKGGFITRGLNLKPLDMCSAVGRVQLGKLGDYLDNRHLISTIYRDELDGVVEFLEVPPYVKRHANMMMPIYVDKPMRLSEDLRKHGIDTRLGWKPLKSTPDADYMYQHIICLPIYNTMKPSEALYVSEKVKTCLQ